MISKPTTRRAVLTAAVAVAAAATAPAGAAARSPRSRPAAAPGYSGAHTHHRAWSTAADWSGGEAEGTAPTDAARAGIVLATPVGTTNYRDPHTGKTATWEYARWTGPSTQPAVRATELIASWNAHTPQGTWIRVELQAGYSDGTESPWYTLGIWTSGDGDDVPRRTSVEGQTDGTSTVHTDTLSLDDAAGSVRFTSYRLRVTLYRAESSESTPTVWRTGVLASAIPDRFEVPASEPGAAAGVELDVPRYSQEIHKGQYPEYDNGGEAWCSPTSSQMIIEFWGRKPTEEDLAWVNPDYADPQVCHAARNTFDYQYEGCGNWPFNAAYAATYDDLQAAVVRLESLVDAERFLAVGIPLITSQSFLESELDGAGYGTAGHLMTLVGCTEDGDVIANDPASPDNPSVRHVYDRRQFENIWLRTKRYDENGEVAGGSGGVCYVYFPTRPTVAQERVLQQYGLS